MDEDLTAAVQFEMMLLSRYQNRVARSDPSGLDRSAFTLLSRLRIDGPMSIGELTEAFGLDTSTVNRQTAALVRHGLAERIPDPDGGIARKFRLTAEGEERLAAANRANHLGAAKVLADWSPTDQAELVAMLRRLNTDIERITGERWPRP